MLPPAWPPRERQRPPWEAANERERGGPSYCDLLRGRRARAAVHPAGRLRVAREFIHRLAAQTKRLRNVGEVLRMAGEQQAARLHERLETREHLRLGRLVEINHHV